MPLLLALVSSRQKTQMKSCQFLGSLGALGTPNLGCAAPYLCRGLWNKRPAHLAIDETRVWWQQRPRLYLKFASLLESPGHQDAGSRCLVLHCSGAFKRVLTCGSQGQSLGLPSLSYCVCGTWHPPILSLSTTTMALIQNS